MAEENDVVRKDPDPDKALEVLRAERGVLHRKLFRADEPLDRERITRRLKANGREIKRIKADKRSIEEEKRSREVEHFMDAKRRQRMRDQERAKDKRRATAQTQLPAPVGVVPGQANIIPRPTRPDVPMTGAERVRLHRNRERAGQVLITIAVNEAALVPRLIADGLLDKSLAGETAAVGFALGELLVLYTRLPAERTRDCSISALRPEEKAQALLEREHAMQQKNDDPDVEIRVAVIKEVETLDGEQLRHLMVKLLDRDWLGTRHKPNEASAQSKPVKRRRASATNYAPVQKALRVIKRGTPEQILDAIQDELHYPVPRDRGDALDWVRRGLVKRRDVLREWPDGSWSHLNWRPELTVA